MHKNAEYYSNFTVPNIDMKQRNRMPQFNGYYKHFYHKTRSYPYPLNSLRLPNQFRRFFQVNHPTFLNYFFPCFKNTQLLCRRARGERPSIPEVFENTRRVTAFTALVDNFRTVPTLLVAIIKNVCFVRVIV